MSRPRAKIVRNIRTLYAASLFIVALAAACSKNAPEPQVTSKLPTTCGRDAFAATVGAFEDIELDRNEVLARVEALPIEEPAEYVRRWDDEKSKLRELSAKADAVGLPRCLENAKELFVHHLAKTQAALELRNPASDFVDYRRERETADSIYGQYQAEVKLQEKNRP